MLEIEQHIGNHLDARVCVCMSEKTFLTVYSFCGSLQLCRSLLSERESVIFCE